MSIRRFGRVFFLTIRKSSETKTWFLIFLRNIAAAETILIGWRRTRARTRQIVSRSPTYYCSDTVPHTASARQHWHARAETTQQLPRVTRTARARHNLLHPPKKINYFSAINRYHNRSRHFPAVHPSYDIVDPRSRSFTRRKLEIVWGGTEKLKKRNDFWNHNAVVVVIEHTLYCIYCPRGGTTLARARRSLSDRNRRSSVSYANPRPANTQRLTRRPATQSSSPSSSHNRRRHRSRRHVPTTRNRSSGGRGCQTLRQRTAT